jgi:hypothetical protein
MKKILLLAILSFALSTNTLADTLTNILSKDEKACELSKYLTHDDLMDNNLNCYDLGSIYKKGLNVEQDDFKALTYWQKACDLNNINGCISLATIYTDAKTIKGQDYWRLDAQIHLDKACSLDITRAIFDDCKATEHYQKTCNSGNSYSCSILGRFHKKSESTNVLRNNFKALKYFKKACDLDNNTGCYDLGTMYENGKGVRQNYTLALKYYGKACDLESELGCENYASLKKK